MPALTDAPAPNSTMTERGAAEFRCPAKRSRSGWGGGGGGGGGSVDDFGASSLMSKTSNADVRLASTARLVAAATKVADMMESGRWCCEESLDIDDQPAPASKYSPPDYYYIYLLARCLARRWMGGWMDTGRENAGPSSFLLLPHRPDREPPSQTHHAFFTAIH